ALQSPVHLGRARFLLGASEAGNPASFRGSPVVRFLPGGFGRFAGAAGTRITGLRRLGAAFFAGCRDRGPVFRPLLPAGGAAALPCGRRAAAWALGSDAPLNVRVDGLAGPRIFGPGARA